MNVNSNKVWGKRLKEAREALGISQRQLGIDAGLDPFVASTRINRYELGVHKADYQVAQRLASVLRVPTAFFYADDDQLAKLIDIYGRLDQGQRGTILEFAERLKSPKY